jgi:hypothetical protein
MFASEREVDEMSAMRERGERSGGEESAGVSFVGNPSNDSPYTNTTTTTADPAQTSNRLRRAIASRLLPFLPLMVVTFVIGYFAAEPSSMDKEKLMAALREVLLLGYGASVQNASDFSSGGTYSRGR